MPTKLKVNVTETVTYEVEIEIDSDLTPDQVSGPGFPGDPSNLPDEAQEQIDTSLAEVDLAQAGARHRASRDIDSVTIVGAA